MVTVDLAATNLAPRTLRALPNDQDIKLPKPAQDQPDPETAADLLGVARRLQRWLDASPDPIFIIDGRFKCIYGNLAAADLLHRTPQEVPGSRFTEYFHPEDVAALSAALNALGDSNQTRVSARTRDELGGMRELEVHLSDLGDRTIQAVVHDVSPWIAQERALRATSDRRRQWLTLAAEPLMIVSMDLQISYANEAIGGLIGLGRDEIMSLALVDLVHPDDREAIAARLIRPPGGDCIASSPLTRDRSGLRISPGSASSRTLPLRKPPVHFGRIPQGFRSSSFCRAAT